MQWKIEPSFIILLPTYKTIVLALSHNKRVQMICNCQYQINHTYHVITHVDLCLFIYLYQF